MQQSGQSQFQSNSYVYGCCPICGFSTTSSVRIQVPVEWTNGPSNVAIICTNCETCILTTDVIKPGQIVPKLETRTTQQCTCSGSRSVPYSIYLAKYNVPNYCGHLKLKCTLCGYERSMDFSDAETSSPVEDQSFSEMRGMLADTTISTKSQSYSSETVGQPDTPVPYGWNLPGNSSLYPNVNPPAQDFGSGDSYGTYPAGDPYGTYPAYPHPTVSNVTTSCAHSSSSSLHDGDHTSQQWYPIEPPRLPETPTNQLEFKSDSGVKDSIYNMWLKSVENAGKSPTCCPNCTNAEKQQPFFNVDGYVSHVLCTTCGARTNWSVGDGKSTPKTLVSELAILKPGDHIAWHRPCGIWHHAIVFDTYISPDYKQVEVVHYNAGMNKLSEGFVSIRREWLDVDVADKNLYRIDYDPATCFPPTTVMARACMRMQETNYNPFKNNCEHFARWCKTGHERSVQIERIPVRIGKAADKVATRIAAQPWFQEAAAKMKGPTDYITNLKNKVQSFW